MRSTETLVATHRPTSAVSKTDLSLAAKKLSLGSDRHLNTLFESNTWNGVENRQTLTCRQRPVYSRKLVIQNSRFQQTSRWSYH